MNFNIAELHFGRFAKELNYSFSYEGHTFEVQRFNAYYSTQAMIKMIENFRKQVDAIAISQLPTAMRLGNKSYVNRDVLEIMSTATHVPLTDGSCVREIALIHSLLGLISKGTIQPERGVFFPLGLLHLTAGRFFSRKYPQTTAFADSLILLGYPKVFKGNDGANALAQLGLYYITNKPITSLGTLRAEALTSGTLETLKLELKNYQYVYGSEEFFKSFGSQIEFLKGKSLIFQSIKEETKKFFLDAGVSEVINLFPEKLTFHPEISYSVLDATLRLSKNKSAALSFEEWKSLLELEMKESFEAREYAVGEQPSLQTKVTQSIYQVKRRFLSQKPPDFAFIVHALSTDDLFKYKGLSWVTKLPSSYKKKLEIFAAHLPGVHFGDLNSVLSKKNGQEVSGLIYGLPATPRVLKEEPVEKTYAKIEKICADAYQRGAQIIGLGAYTKIVGDAGLTINGLSPIPVTTGNSLSASATLWALREAVQKMNLLKTKPGLNVFDGTAMVVGATGSIGSVSAKLLAPAFSRLIIVAPRVEKLKELREEILMLAPNCQVICSSDANLYAEQADAVVTATSAFDQKILDVDLIKPGCVICDCSRPLDFTVEDALKRPDVLIIESGEVTLPGPAELTCNIGLPKGVFYACLAETVLLALEKRFESFTLGRDIEWDKVKEIYKLAREHGVELAAMYGHMGPITDKEIQLTRALALKKRSL